MSRSAKVPRDYYDSNARKRSRPDDDDEDQRAKRPRYSSEEGRSQNFSTSFWKCCSYITPRIRCNKLISEGFMCQECSYFNRSFDYHRFDAIKRASFPFVCRNQIGQLALIIREDLIESIVKLVSKLTGNTSLYYNLAISLEIQKLIEDKISAYMSKDFITEVVNTLLEEKEDEKKDRKQEKEGDYKRELREFLVSKGRRKQVPFRNFLTEKDEIYAPERLSYMILTKKVFRQALEIETAEQEKEHANKVSQALFLVLAMSEIVWHERLMSFFLHSAKLPSFPGDFGDFAHAKAVMCSRAICHHLRKRVNLTQFYPVPFWESAIEWLFTSSNLPPDPPPFFKDFEQKAVDYSMVLKKNIFLSELKAVCPDHQPASPLRPDIIYHRLISSFRLDLTPLPRATQDFSQFDYFSSEVNYVEKVFLDINEVRLTGQGYTN